MSKLPHVDSYGDLVVYKKARQLSLELFMITKSFPREEMFSLTDQIRRSSRSIGAQIAEAWAKRRYEKHFVSKLIDADGEQQETQHWINMAADCGYLTQSQTLIFKDKCAEIGRLLGGMIAKADLFCGSLPITIRETSEFYLISEPESVTTDN
jgi:four helix bundle protein